MLNEDGHSLSYPLPDALPVETAAAGKEGHKDKDNSDLFVKSKYLTVDITNGREATLTELSQRFPRIRILNLPYPISGNHLSIYGVDPNKLTLENYQRRLKK